MEDKDKEHNIEYPNLTPHKMKNIIRKLRPYKAPGQDGIQEKQKWKLLKKLIWQLHHIYKNNHFPNIWKRAKIIPILKPGKNSSQTLSYRPISLLPILGKIPEKVIIDIDRQNLIMDNLLINEQHGFRPIPTTKHQVSRIIHDSKLNCNWPKIWPCQESYQDNKELPRKQNQPNYNKLWHI